MPDQEVHAAFSSATVVIRVMGSSEEMSRQGRRFSWGVTQYVQVMDFSIT